MTENKQDGLEFISPYSSLNIYKKMLLCMKELRYIQKDGKIDRSFSFASHDKVTEECMDVFIKYNLFPQVTIIKESLDLVTVKKYNKYDKVSFEQTEYLASVQAQYRIINADNPCETITFNGFGQGQDNQDKALGKATSYACKYALLKGLGIKTGDDPDKDADSTSRIVNSSKKTQTNSEPLTFKIDGVYYPATQLQLFVLEKIREMFFESDLEDYYEWRTRNSKELGRYASLYPDNAEQLKIALDKAKVAFESSESED